MPGHIKIFNNYMYNVILPPILKQQMQSYKILECQTLILLILLPWHPSLGLLLGDNVENPCQIIIVKTVIHIANWLFWILTF